MILDYAEVQREAVGSKRFYLCHDGEESEYFLVPIKDFRELQKEFNKLNQEEAELTAIGDSLDQQLEYSLWEKLDKEKKIDEIQEQITEYQKKYEHYKQLKEQLIFFQRP